MTAEHVKLMKVGEYIELYKGGTVNCSIHVGEQWIMVREDKEVGKWFRTHSRLNKVHFR